MQRVTWRKWWAAVPLLAVLALLALAAIHLSNIMADPDGAPAGAAPPRERDLGRPSSLPLPSTVSVAQFEAKLFAFLNERRYVTLGWMQDRCVRDAGPYVAGKSHGTHPAVRVFYSPEVMRWLMNGQAGRIPDGAMIVKEQYAAPAARHDGKTDAALWNSLESWAVMVKDAAGSQDGWFWSNPAKGQCVIDNQRYPFPPAVSGFGLYCVRCHASTQSPGTAITAETNEFTFAALRNIAGFPGQPILYRVDDSWHKDTHKQQSADSPHLRCVRPQAPARLARSADPAFLRLFGSIRPVQLAEVAHLPPETHDWVVSRRDAAQEFVTSNQCMSCHAGLTAPFGPAMFVPTGASVEYGAPGWDVSPFGEWRWTPMGLAGRDPIFHAQLESELALLQKHFYADPAGARELCTTLTDTCLRCHSAMGKRQFDRDHSEAGAHLSLAHVHAVAGPEEDLGRGVATYGALARDGVGCMVCHRMQPRAQPADDHRPYLQFFLETSITGQFQLGKRGEIYGPYRDDAIAPYAMEHATGWRPRHSDFLKSSQLCGTCHTVALPAIDRPLGHDGAAHEADELTRAETVPLYRKFHQHIEQATYLEWLNSEYENEINPQNPRAKSCQDCHMARGLKDERHGIDMAQLHPRIAVIQDTTYPDAENLAPHDWLRIRPRHEGYRRHNFAGLNVFLLELFKQFDDVLGLPKDDFMTGSKQGIAHATDEFVRTARNDVATLTVEATWDASHRLLARVVVHNKVGHRFPSGVGFRRAFIELQVIETAPDGCGPEPVIWSSGRTNELGVLVDSGGQPLPTEFFARDPASGRQQYQKHHQVITSPAQVRVYETLLRDAQGNITTSFVRGCDVVKDNRLLPRGWKRQGPGPALTGRFLQATQPGPDVANDARYIDGSGSDQVNYQVDLPGNVDPSRLRVRATLYYQPVPPYYLRNLFETAPDGPATRRLHYLCSHVDLRGTPIEGWKLPITSADCRVTQPR